MSESISILATFNINEGKFDDLKEVVARGVEIARQEPDCQAYEIWKSDGGSTLHWFEQYRDSAAVLAHIQSMQDVMPQLIACATPTSFTMYGPASEQLRGAVSPFGTAHMASLGGFTH